MNAQATKMSGRRWHGTNLLEVPVALLVPTAVFAADVVAGYGWPHAKRGLRLGNLHDEVLGYGICTGSRYARLRLHVLFQHDEDGAGSCASAGGAAHGLP